MSTHPSPITVLTAWSFEPTVILSVALAAWIYIEGLRELARRGRLRRSVAPWQIASFGLGLLCILLGLISPIDTLSNQLLTAHMVQHLLLLMIAPPLLLLGKPIPVLLVGAPHGLVRSIARAHAKTPWFHDLTHLLTRAYVAWPLFVVTMLTWHLPVFYDAALNNVTVHLFEHVCFLVTGIIFWSVVVQPFPGPRRLAHGWRFLYVMAAMVPDSVLGSWFMVDGSPVYSFYAALPRLWDISVLDDQSLAGNIMLIGGDFVFAIALIPLFGGMMNRFEQRELARWAESDTVEEHATSTG
jgi:cytochrome c oxidase assembly factor CtaG